MIGINETFDLTTDGKVVLSALTLATPVFRRIYEGIPDRERAIKEIEYIIFKHHYKSPYHVYGGPHEREEHVKLSIFGDAKYEVSDLTKESEIEYSEELQSSELIQLLESARIGISYINKSFRELQSQGGVNPKDVITWTEKLGPMALSIDTIEKKVKANELNASKVKGDREVRAYEIPKK